jgi:hypothetical protein
MKAWHKWFWLYLGLTWAASIPWIVYLVFAKGYPKSILVCIPFYMLLVKGVFDIIKPKNGKATDSQPNK